MSAYKLQVINAYTLRMFTRRMRTVLSCLLFLVQKSESWQVLGNSRLRAPRKSCSASRMVLLAASDENIEENTANATASLYAALRSRSRQVETEKALLLNGWRKGKCSSRVAVVLEDDWVRRCDLSGSLIALGTASGSVHVVDTSRGVTQLITRSEGAMKAHPRYAEGAQDLSVLHGSFDGGGVTALAIHGKILATGGREGDLKIWSATGHGKPELEFSAICGSDNNVVAAVAVLDSAVAAACLDGSLRLYRRMRTGVQSDHEENDIVWTTEWSTQAMENNGNNQTTTAILCLTTFFSDTPISSAPAEIIVCGCSDGTVRFYHDGKTLPDLDWKPFIDSSTRSLTITPQYIYAGSSRGALKRRRIDLNNLVYDQSTTEESLLPNHSGAIVSLVHRDGILCSGSTDGTIRIWDTRPRSDKSPPSVCYGFGGFKVWLGSLACNDKILLSDGSDNTIIYHDFASPPPPPPSTSGGSGGPTASSSDDDGA